MKDLIVKATESTPEVNFSYKQNKLIIKGESYPDNVAKFYTPILSWIRNYLNQVKNEHTSFDIEIIYFNSSTSKVFMDIFDMFNTATNKGKDITVNWIYDEENEGILEYGEEFKDEFESLIFNLKVKK
ncbi:MAG: DUF1987 domain-containing protein [Desulfobacterales bacterium]|nr:DUF1987 domain-containing protein [Desulfobacterales bacterium]